MAMLLSWMLATGWGPGATSPFTVTGFSPADGALAVNGQIEVRFSHRIHQETPIQALVGLFDESGEPVPCLHSLHEDRVVLLPPPPGNWDQNTTLTLRVRRGLAVPFRDADRRTLQQDHEFEFAVGSRFLDYGQPLEFYAPNAEVRSGLQAGSTIAIQTSLMLDAASLDGADAVVIRRILPDGTFGPAITPDVEFDESLNNLLIRPWAKGNELVAAARYQIVLNGDSMLARNGRRCDSDFVTTFSTARDIGFEGHLDVSFARQHLPAAENPRLSPDLSYACPQLAPMTIKSSGVEETRALKADAPIIFGAVGKKIQLKIPGKLLGDMPGTITGLSWFCTMQNPAAMLEAFRRDGEIPHLIEQDVIFPRLLIRLGHATFEAQRNGLVENFDRNLDDFSGRPVIQTVAAGSFRGEYVVRRRRIKIHRIQGEELLEDGAWIDLMFERPFAYEGNRRDVIVEIENVRGSAALDGSPLSPTNSDLLWWVRESKDPRPNFLTTIPQKAGEAAKNRTASLDFATRIHIQSYLEIVSEWYAADIDDPEYFLVTSADYLDARGAEHEDFQFVFQGKRLDGSLTPWTRLEALDNCRKIRVRLRFLPRAGRRIGPEPEVRSLRIRYRRR